MISLLITSRIEGNPNWGLANLLDGLKEKSSHYDNFEVLVKFDSDDRLVPEFVRTLDQYPFAIKHLIEPRGRGYIDIHIGYTRVMSLADSRSTVMGCFADDFIIVKEGWDEDILSRTNSFDDDIYIIHQLPHPPFYRPDYKDSPFYLHFSLDHMDTLEVIDEGPFWSRKLLEICGGLGHVSFTDAWTLCLQWYLHHHHGINRTLFTDQPLIHRRLHEAVDSDQSERWHSDRKWNFDFIANDFYRTMVKNQARNIALNISSGLPIEGNKLVRHPSKNLERILMQTAKGAIEQTKHHSAVRELEVITEQFPNNMDAHQMLGLLNLFMNQPQAAIPSLQYVLNSAPNTRGVRNQLGVAFATAGAENEAKTLFMDELNRFPASEQAKVNLMKLSGEQSGRPSQATEFAIT